MWNFSISVNVKYNHLVTFYSCRYIFVCEHGIMMKTCDIATVSYISLFTCVHCSSLVPQCTVRSFVTPSAERNRSNETLNWCVKIALLIGFSDVMKFYHEEFILRDTKAYLELISWKPPPCWSSFNIFLNCTANDQIMSLSNIPICYMYQVISCKNCKCKQISTAMISIMLKVKYRLSVEHHIYSWHVSP